MNPLHSRHTGIRPWLYPGIGLLVLLLFAADLMSGSVAIPWRQVLAGFSGDGGPDPVYRDILLRLRLPRAATALLAGAALSLCGLQMQTLFRNPLADPYILGISSGAGLGVACFVMGSAWLGSGILSGFGTVSAAWAGALAFTLLILWASARLKDNLSLLIFGVMLGSVGSAVISLLQYVSDAESLKNYVLWSMGSFSGLSGGQVLLLAALVTAGTGISLSNIKALNALLLGETYAHSLGMNLHRLRWKILLSVALLAGSVTAFCGPIGFIGIAVPHIARMLFRDADHRRLMPATLLLGCAVMLLADIIAQWPGSSAIIPINTVCALLGIPVIILIILKQKHEA